MKTNVAMTRTMGDFEVIQRTKDGMFNATSLLKQWNSHSGQKKEIAHFFENKSTEEFIQTLVNESESKHRNSVYLKTRGKYGGTWMTPYLFLDFAMWINPKFKLEVIKFVYDNLIAFRKDAGTRFLGLTNAASRLVGCNYSQLAKGLNWIVFNEHQKQRRNKATEQQMNELVDVEKKLAFAIDMGYIKTFDGLLDEMRRMYHIKWNNNERLD